MPTTHCRRRRRSIPQNLRNNASHNSLGKKILQTKHVCGAENVLKPQQKYYTNIKINNLFVWKNVCYIYSSAKYISTYMNKIYTYTSRIFFLVNHCYLLLLLIPPHLCSPRDYLSHSLSLYIALTHQRHSTIHDARLTSAKMRWWRANQTFYCYIFVLATTTAGIFTFLLLS